MPASESSNYGFQYTTSTGLSIAPDGSQTAIQAAPNTLSTTDHYIHEASISVSTSTTYTMSQFVKKGSYQYHHLRSVFANGDYDLRTVFDLDNGTITSQPNDIDDASITDIGNGWYRISATYTTPSTLPNPTLLFRFHIGANVSYAGNDYDYTLCWGSQVEAGSFPTSYIPTSGSTVTRSGDLPLISGSNFTSWFNDMPLSAYVEYDLQTSAINQRIFSIDTNGYDPRLVVLGSVSNAYGPMVELYSNGIFYATLTSGATTPTESGTHKLAFAFADNDAANSKDGAAVVTDTTFVFPSNFSQIRLGSQANGNNFMQGTIKKLAFYPKRLPNATLQAMTEA